MNLLCGCAGKSKRFDINPTTMSKLKPPSAGNSKFINRPPVQRTQTLPSTSSSSQDLASTGYQSDSIQPPTNSRLSSGLTLNPSVLSSETKERNGHYISRNRTRDKPRPKSSSIAMISQGSSASTSTTQSFPSSEELSYPVPSKQKSGIRSLFSKMKSSTKAIPGNSNMNNSKSDSHLSMKEHGISQPKGAGKIPASKSGSIKTRFNSSVKSTSAISKPVSHSKPDACIATHNAGTAEKSAPAAAIGQSAALPKSAALPNAKNSSKLKPTRQFYNASSRLAPTKVGVTSGSKDQYSSSDHITDNSTQSSKSIASQEGIELSPISQPRPASDILVETKETSLIEGSLVQPKSLHTSGLLRPSGMAAGTYYVGLMRKCGYRPQPNCW